MPTYDRKNPFELAAFAYELGSPSSYIDAGATGGVMVWARRAYCPGCYKFGTLIRELDEKGKHQFRCTSCKSVHKRVVKLKPIGTTRAKADHVPHVHSMADEAANLDLAAIIKTMKELPPDATKWFLYAHTSQYDEKTRPHAQKQLFASVIVRVNKRVGQLNLADATKLHTVIELIISGRAPGAESISDYALAKAINIDHKVFGAEKRWGKYRQYIEGVLNNWDQQIFDAFSPFTE